jgi:hypothetical protein
MNGCELYGKAGKKVIEAFNTKHGGYRRARSSPRASRIEDGGAVQSPLRPVLLHLQQGLHSECSAMISGAGIHRHLQRRFDTRRYIDSL